MRVIKTYKAPIQMNAACMDPHSDVIVMAGGQAARDVTTTAGSAGHFETMLMHKVYEEPLGHMKLHFGPTNALAFNPNGMGMASGAEDGMIIMVYFDESYDALTLEEDVSQLEKELEAAESSASAAVAVASDATASA